MEIAVVIGFAVIAIGLLQCVDTPHSWWKWRIVQRGDEYFIESKGWLKPWWHTIPDFYGSPMRFTDVKEARMVLEKHAAKERMRVVE
jgi:hypothetical protein